MTILFGLQLQIVNLVLKEYNGFIVFHASLIWFFKQDAGKGFTEDDMEIIRTSSLQDLHIGCGKLFEVVSLLSLNLLNRVLI